MATYIAASAAESRSLEDRCEGPTTTPPTLTVTPARPSGKRAASARNPVDDVVGHQLGRLLVGVRQQERELVATEPRHQVGRAQPVVEECRHLDQEVVADPVAEGVVDVLEVVQVEHQQGAARSVADTVVDVSGQVLVEAAAVGQPGERVVLGEEGQLPLVAVPLGDVHDVGEDLVHAPVLTLEHGADQDDVQLLVVVTADRPPHLRAMVVGGADLLQVRGDGLVPRVEGPGGQRPADQVGVAEQQLESRVGLADDAGQVEQRDALGSVLEHPLGPLLGRREHPLALPVTAHVAGHHERLAPVADGGERTGGELVLGALDRRVDGFALPAGERQVEDPAQGARRGLVDDLGQPAAGPVSQLVHQHAGAGHHLDAGALLDHDHRRLGQVVRQRPPPLLRLGKGALGEDRGGGVDRDEQVADQGALVVAQLGHARQHEDPLAVRADHRPDPAAGVLVGQPGEDGEARLDLQLARHRDQLAPVEERLGGITTGDCVGGVAQQGLGADPEGGDPALDVGGHQRTEGRAADDALEPGGGLPAAPVLLGEAAHDTLHGRRQDGRHPGEHDGAAPLARRVGLAADEQDRRDVGEGDQRDRRSQVATGAEDGQPDHRHDRQRGQAGGGATGGVAQQDHQREHPQRRHQVEPRAVGPAQGGPVRGVQPRRHHGDHDEVCPGAEVRRQSGDQHAEPDQGLEGSRRPRGRS